MGKKLCVVGIDPGMTTGMAILRGEKGKKYSSGTWDVDVRQYSVEQLQSLGSEISEGIWKEVSAIRGLEESLKWWSSMSQAGAGLAMVTLEALAEGMGGLKAVETGFGDVEGLVMVEDFLLRPNDKGLGGRTVVSPVAISAAFMAIWQQVSSVRIGFSQAADKSLVTDAQIKRWFGDGGAEPGGTGGRWLGHGKPHGVDGLRHAVLGVRRV